MGTMDELIDPGVVARLRDSLTAVAPGLPLPALTEAGRAIPGKRLRDRVDIVRDALLTDVPAGFPAARRMVLDLLKVPQFGGWSIWPTSEFVTARALETGSTTDFDAAMEVLAQLTIGLSSEFAVRDLLIARPERALGVMRSWTGHENEHVRRLATEGSRSYLPWAKRVPWLIAHPDATRGILDAIYRDPAEYVRRSVANHLNDLSRVDPALVAEIGRGWHGQPDVNTPWVLRHGLRTLVKKGDPESLSLLGYKGDGLSVGLPRLSSPSVPQGGALEFSAVVTNDGSIDAAVAIDYSIGFLRANGSVSPKTFKLASRRLAPGESVVVSKTHSFRPITTRTYYPGRHSVTVQVNGKVSPSADFALEGDAGPQQG
ncbi:DNA alkylation repair protein [Microbacterium sp. W4I20]|uniref:DNA alkylation repair protein n=1 Tax=Microbacterium sp. W4I20 TaxID=3042262 RepID=UPI002789D8A4|nr:DNA alkylation repair protein [Microbacterium sp. W4I20]MDQ0727983.1 3-methyladenine DNA glycosylase AlkC [Microbacterium sp. W4I20]